MLKLISKKEYGRMLDVSYPTARKYYDQDAKALGVKKLNVVVVSKLHGMTVDEVLKALKNK